MSTPIFRDEAEFVSSLIEHAQIHGWKVAHIRPARTGRKYVNQRGQEREVWNTPYEGDAGLPDLILAKHGVVLFWECKMPEKVPTVNQIQWLQDTKGRVLYPADYDWAVEQLATLGKE